jgi:hypothetical protein
VLSDVERHELKDDRHGHDVNSPRAVHHVVMKRGFWPKLFYLFVSGHCGPRNLSSSRMLYRKKPEKLEQIE